MSIFDLPRPRLRTSLLVLLTIAPPLAAYEAQYAPGTHRSHAEAFGDDCRYDDYASRLIRRNDVYIDADESDWPQLKQVVQKFAASHAMRMVPGDPQSSARGDPFEYGVCMPGRFVFSFTKTPDAPSSHFEPKGDRYVTLTSFVARGQRWEYTLRALAAAIDSQWPGIKLGSDVDLGPPLNWRKIDSNTCRTKVAKMEYKFCLGALSDVRKETLYVHGPTNDWSRLQSLMAEFAASHAMAFNTAENNSAFPWIDLCAAGKVQINSTVNVRDVPLVRGENFHVQIVTYIPPANPDATATVDRLVAALDAEWPGVMRSQPEPDFCRALKAQK